MAIIGTFHHWANHTDEFTTQIIEVTYPNDLPEDDPDYDKRGTTEQVEAQNPVMTAVHYPGAYANISQITVNRKFVYNEENDLIKIYEIQYTIFVYSSKDSYEDGVPEIYRHPIYNELYEGDHNNIFEYAYNSLKQRQGFEDMIDDI